MPAYDWEVEEALSEGVQLHDRWGIAGFEGDASVRSVELKRCTSVFDLDGRFSPRYDDSVVEELSCDVAIVAVGMGADTGAFPALAPDGARTLQADSETLQTSVDWVFAAGDAVTGPAMITDAVGQGRRAAHMIDRFLQGRPLDGFDAPLPVVEHADILARQHGYARREPLEGALRAAAAPSDFAELEPPLSEADARAAAGRCLDCGVCSECHECIAACPADAIDLDMRTETMNVDVGSVIVSTGYALFPADAKPQYGYGTLQERDHGDTDGATARPDEALQHGAAAGRRQSAGADRVRDVHRLARSDGR